LKRRVVISALAIGLLFVLGGFLAVVATASGGNASKTSSTPDDYAVVELADSPVARYTGGIAGIPATKPLHGHKLDLASANVVQYEAYLSIGHASFQAWLKSNAPWAQVVREYSLTFNGFAVLLNGNSLSSLANAPGVKSVTPSWVYYPTMDVSVPLIQAPPVWDQLGVDPMNGDFGDLSSVKVGVIDTGIDDSHPFIASCRAENSIVHDVFFSGAGLFDPSRTLFFDHGTHVSGTIGGCPIEGTVPVQGKNLTLAGPLIGVAPGVTLHDYNVFPGYGSAFIHHGGGAFSHDIIAAVEKSVADGMDVINLSIGGNVQGPSDTLAVAINAAVDAGVVAVIAAGNSGPGIETVESPGTAANAITAGASADPHYLGISVHQGADTFGAAIGPVFANFDPAITAPSSLTTPADGCTAISTDLTGKIALINRGVCFFSVKIQNAQDAGALGVLIVNNNPSDPIPMGSDGVHFPTIAAAMVSQADGAVLKAAAPTTITVDGETYLDVVTSNADILASFSSKGPTPYDFRLKPDVVAPGVNVLSSILDGQYDFFQGTSMATPHTAGSAALLLALHPGWSPQEVKSALVNNADRPALLESSLGGLGPIARGGGRINVARAGDAQIFLDPASVSFGAFTGGKAAASSVAVGFENTMGSAVTCSLSLTINVAAAAPFFSLSAESLSIPAHATEMVTVAFNGGQSIPTGAFWGDLVASCGSTTLKAPWWVGIQRSNGFLNGNQHSTLPSDFGLDPAVYADLTQTSAVPWTQ